MRTEQGEARSFLEYPAGKGGELVVGCCIPFSKPSKRSQHYSRKIYFLAAAARVHWRNLVRRESNWYTGTLTSVEKLILLYASITVRLSCP